MTPLSGLKYLPASALVTRSGSGQCRDIHAGLYTHSGLSAAPGHSKGVAK